MSQQDQPATRDHEDRILPATRAVSAIIIPFLVVAFVILFFMPDETGRYFAWPIGPRMNAMMLGATYLSGVFYFATVLFARRWQQVKFGLIPVASFAALMGIATILHWQAFNFDLTAGWVWVILYATTPFIVLGLWLWNTRIGRPGTARPGDHVLPPVVRGAVGLVGLTGLVVSLLLFVAPGLMIEIWPWSLSALTARVISAQFVVFSLFSLAAYLDPRWESLRLVIRSELPAPVFFLIAMAASWNDFDNANPLTWVFAFNVVVVFVIGVPAMYVYMEGRAKRRAAIAAQTPDRIGPHRA